ncbi:MAG: GNAT family protein [Lachnospiraceae bacterium]|nr:GNAT family protein [Lachnospiraceae bacterium]
MQNVTFREPVIEDAKEIVDFYNYVGGETSFLSFEKDEYPLDVEAQKESIKETNESPINTMLLAIVDGKIVGIGTISSSHKIKSRHSGELGIVVVQEYQGKGIGSSIIQQLIDWAKGNGVTTRIQLDTRTDNELAVKLYQKFGFEIEGCLKNSTLLDGKYYDLYVMGMMIK